MRPLFTIALLVLIVGFGHLALAKGGAASGDPIQKKVPHCSGSHESHSPEQKCRQQQGATGEKVDADTGVQTGSQQGRKASAASIPAEKKIIEVKEVTEPKKESTNLTFNFLYYIFYKFSVSDFFQAPSYTN